mmetsp:Transcript_127475/g.407982  ORF Transcript_127475/g.407982 Transcript_127475/m.407982 type:complete len:524 (+) Transcript_127475:59-1630(+)
MSCDGRRPGPRDSTYAVLAVDFMEEDEEEDEEQVRVPHRRQPAQCVRSVRTMLLPIEEYASLEPPLVSIRRGLSVWRSRVSGCASTSAWALALALLLLGAAAMNRGRSFSSLRGDHVLRHGALQLKASGSATEFRLAPDPLATPWVAPPLQWTPLPPPISLPPPPLPLPLPPPPPLQWTPPAYLTIEPLGSPLTLEAPTTTTKLSPMELAELRGRQELEGAAVVEVVGNAVVVANTTASPVMSTSTSTGTKTATSTSTTRWPSPSFFCLTVVRAGGYEPDLVKAQYEQKVGIFACDEYTVFSNGGVVQVGDLQTQDLPVAPVTMGNMSKVGTTTSSWLNTMIFMKMWDLIAGSGKWWDHDWTVKVDPDAVFFPSRLREYLAPQMASFGDAALYVGNCDRTWHNGPVRLKLFGSLEIFNRNAIGSYKASNARCKAELPWQGWGEDFFMQQCLDLAGVHALNGTQYLADARCEWSPCTDPTKVAFHDFKTIPAWFDCWGQSEQRERLKHWPHLDEMEVVMKRLEK